MSSFQINGVSPPSGGKPHGKGYWLHQPKATGTDGYNRPCGAVGLPWLEIKYIACDQTVWNWFMAHTEQDLSAGLTSVEIWNDFKTIETGGAGWEVFSGSGIRIHRPTYDDINFGLYYGVKIVITNLS